MIYCDAVIFYMNQAYQKIPVHMCVGWEKITCWQLEKLSEKTKGEPHFMTTPVCYA